jgi:hypothetical protein
VAGWLRWLTTAPGGAGGRNPTTALDPPTGRRPGPKRKGPAGTPLPTGPTNARRQPRVNPTGEHTKGTGPEGQPNNRQSHRRAVAYGLAKRAAMRSGLRHCVPLLDVLERLHLATSPHRATVHPSQEWLATELGCSVRTVRYQVKALRDAGIVLVHLGRYYQRGGAGGPIRRVVRQSPSPKTPCWGVHEHGADPPVPPPPMGSTPRTPAIAVPGLDDADEPPYEGPTDTGRAAMRAALAALKPRPRWTR